MVEHRSPKPGVAGSSPVSPARSYPYLLIALKCAIFLFFIESPYLLKSSSPDTGLPQAEPNHGVSCYADTMEKLLITGAAGFVGTNLTKYFLGRGYKVTGIDIADRHMRLKHAGIVGNKDFEFREVNLAKDKIDAGGLSDIEAIIHLAALPHVDYSHFHPHLAISNNIESLLAAIELAIQLQVPLIFSSSVEYYGGTVDKLYAENDPPTPLSPYAASKVAGEAIIQAYIKSLDLHATIYRFTNLYGPWQAPDRLVPRITAQNLLGHDAAVEKGTYRDFVFISDACEVLEKALSLDHTGEVFNLSSGQRVDNFQAVQLIANQVSNDNLKVIEPRRNDGRGKFLVSSPEKLHDRTGWEATTVLSKGIDMTVKWYEAHQNWLTQFEDQLKADRTNSSFLSDHEAISLFNYPVFPNVVH